MDPRVTIYGRLLFLKKAVTLLTDAISEVESQIGEVLAIESRGSISPAAASRSRPRKPRAASKPRASAESTDNLPPLDDSQEYTAKEAAPYMGIKVGTLRGHIAEEIIEVTRNENGRVRILGSEIRKRRAEMGLENAA